MTRSPGDETPLSMDGEDHRGTGNPVGPALTIVGGQPSPMRLALADQQRPSGIEALLRAAASNPDLKGTLLEDRVAAAARAGIEMTPSEHDALASISDGVLIAMLDAVARQTAPKGDR